MDLDFWAARINSARHLSAVQTNRLSNSAESLLETTSLLTGRDFMSRCRGIILNEKPSQTSNIYPMDGFIWHFTFLTWKRSDFQQITMDNLSNVDNVEGEEDVRAWFPCPFCYIEIEVQMLCNHLQEEHCFDLINAVCPICAANLGKDPPGHFTVQHAQSVKRGRKYQKSGLWNNTSAISGKDPHEINSFLCTNIMVGRYNVQEPAPDPLLLPFLCNTVHSDSKDGLQDESPGSVAAAPDVESSKLPICDPAKEEQYEEKRRRAAFLQELIASTIF